MKLALLIIVFLALTSSPRAASVSRPSGIPWTILRRGDVTFTVTARGELQGGKSEMLTAPMTGGNDIDLDKKDQKR